MRKRSLLALLAGLLLIVGLLIVGSPPAVRADAVILPTDDTWVDLNEPTTNYNNGMLIADFSNAFNYCVNTRLIYLRFDLSSLTGDVGSLTSIRLNVRLWEPYVPGTLAIWSTGDDWNGAEAGTGDESTLIYNNRPAAITELDTQATASETAWIAFTGSALSNYINEQRSGDGVASFIVAWQTCTTEMADGIAFEDSENSGGFGTEFRPYMDARDPTAVTLAGFAASSAEDGIQVAWETAVEIDNLGFNLYRALSPEGERAQLNETLIPSASPGGLTGAQYAFVDRAVTPGTTYYYWLETVDVHAGRELHGPASAAAAWPQRVYLPLVCRVP